MKFLSAAVLVVASCLPTAGLAQGKGDVSGDGSGDPESRQGPTTRFEQRREGMFEITQHANGSVSERLIPPDEVKLLRANGDISAVNGEHLCRVEAHPNPRRLAPGESGELRVLVTLAGNAVALPGKHIALSLKPIEGFKFGTPVLEPATVGKLAGKFQGKPVYDDFMLFRVPLTVAASVESPAQQFVGGTLKIELQDGQNGGKIGGFSCPVTGRIDIGKSLPKFRVAGGSKSKSKRAAKAKKLANSRIGSPTRSKSVPGKAAPIIDEVVKGADAADPGPEDPAAGSMVDGADEDTNLLAWGFGGFGALVLLLLVLVRRR